MILKNSERLQEKLTTETNIRSPSFLALCEIKKYVKDKNSNKKNMKKDIALCSDKIISVSSISRAVENKKLHLRSSSSIQSKEKK